jgi:hypothetical protein
MMTKARRPPPLSTPAQCKLVIWKINASCFIFKKRRRLPSKGLCHEMEIIFFYIMGFQICKVLS